MSDLTDAVRAEIQSLRKGRGLPAAALDERRVPRLWELATGQSGSCTPDRQCLVTEINACAAELADDLRTAILASLGTATQTRNMPRLTDRIEWLASQLGRSYRVALRRVDLAEELLAEEVARELRRRRGQAANVPNGWYLEEFRTLLRLDTPTPEAHERRRIVAARDDLREVMAWLDVPRESDQRRPSLEAEVTYGGRLVRREQPSDSRFQFIVRLPSPLLAGDAHEYGLVLRIPKGQPMKPHYVFTPEHPCQAFELQVRFAQDSFPRWVRRVEGETVRMFDYPRPADDLLVPDGAGEVQVRFRNPTLYLGYGIQWGW